MELFSTSAIGPTRQCFKPTALMAFIVVYWPINLLTSSIMLDQSSVRRGFLALLSVPAMPRLRGKPRRGASWYAVASRRKRHKEIQNAVTLVKRRRRQAIRAVNSPPGTIIEEDPSIQLPQDFSPQKMVTFPDDWDPLAHVFRSRITPPGSTSSDSYAKASLDPGRAQCIIEEEQAMEAEPVQNEDCQGHDEAQSRSPSLPPLPPKHLHLIFDLRSLVEDLIFRAVYTIQRLDMLYTAY